MGLGRGVSMYFYAPVVLLSAFLAGHYATRLWSE